MELHFRHYHLLYSWILSPELAPFPSPLVFSILMWTGYVHILSLQVRNFKHSKNDIQLPSGAIRSLDPSYDLFLQAIEDPALGTKSCHITGHLISLFQSLSGLCQQLMKALLQKIEGKKTCWFIQEKPGLILSTKNKNWGDFPSGPVVITSCSHLQGVLV